MEHWHKNGFIKTYRSSCLQMLFKIGGLNRWPQYVAIFTGKLLMDSHFNKVASRTLLKRDSDTGVSP